ncbi:hypothetical protein JW979_01320, partial [bacterium]|nr:hypothetical protein [candidate division CSSED10-310 bacterium]
ALSFFRRCYVLDPTDTLGIRFSIHNITNENVPELNKINEPEIDPYLHYMKYNIPIRDAYDPNIKLNYKEWIDKGKNYQFILIAEAHNNDTSLMGMKADDIHLHFLQHQMVETALALNDPKELRLDLARLVASGMTRHDAIHYLGRQFMTFVQEIMKSRQQQMGKED